MSPITPMKGPRNCCGCGTCQHQRPTDGQWLRRRGENINNEVIHLSSSISGGSEEEMKEEHSEGGEEDRTELQSQEESEDDD